MISRFDDPEALSRAAADLFVHVAQDSIRKRGRFGVALSGGQTPRMTYRLLAQPAWREATAWSKVHVFWGDERCVASDDERHNARMAKRELLDHVPVDSAHVHPIHCQNDPAAEALRYSQVLRRHLPAAEPVLDLVLLGLGQNGHTASLFPYSPVLQDTQRWAAEVYAAEQRLYRVTLTPLVINRARVVAFLVFGRDKAQILKAILEGPTDSQRLPAQLIQPQNGRLIWMVDREAAGLLSAKSLSADGTNDQLL